MWVLWHWVLYSVKNLASAWNGKNNLINLRACSLFPCSLRAQASYPVNLLLCKGNRLSNEVTCIRIRTWEAVVSGWGCGLSTRHGIRESRIMLLPAFTRHCQAGSLHEREFCGVFVNHCCLYRGSEETRNINSTMMMIMMMLMIKAKDWR
jgi:hypothetical protein